MSARGDNEKWGLPCGGRLELAIQQLDSKDLHWVRDVYQAMMARQTLSRTVADLRRNSGSSCRTVRPFRSARRCDDALLRTTTSTFYSSARQLAASLCTLALAMDYEVMLADSREWALDQWQGPQVQKILGLPDDVVREHAADEHCAVITLSHDPRVRLTWR